MKKLLLLICVGWAGSCFAQQDSLSIEDKIASYPSSKYEEIVKGRMLLMDNFKKGNLDEVANIMEYFDEKVEDRRNIALQPSERLLLYYWTQDYLKLINFDFDNASGSEPTTSQVVLPPDDQLFDKVAQQSRLEFDNLVADVEVANLTEDSKTFLVLLLERLLIDKEEKFRTLKEVNKKAVSFINIYPDSPYTDIVKEYVSYKWEMDDWMFSTIVGGGYTFSSGNIRDYFRPQGDLTLSLDAYYKRTAFYLMMNNGFGDTQQDIQVKNDYYWLEGESATLSSVGLALGYSVFDNVRFRVTPFAGVSFGFVSPSDEELPEELDNFTIGTAVSPMLGLNLNYRLRDPEKEAGGSASNFGLGGCYGIYLRAAYVPSFLNREKREYAGSLLFVSIGLSIDIGKMKRVYQ